MQQSSQSFQCILVIAERSAPDMQHLDTSVGHQRQHSTAHEELQNCMQELERSQGTINWLLYSTSVIARHALTCFVNSIQSIQLLVHYHYITCALQLICALLWVSHAHRLVYERAVRTCHVWT